MRKLIPAIAVLGLMATQVNAADRNDYGPEFRAYAAFNIGASKQKSMGLHYGFRMDHDSRQSSVFGTNNRAIVKVDFSKASGFEGASLYGMPLNPGAYQKMNQLAPGTATAVLWATTILIAGGAGYAIYELQKDPDNQSQPCKSPSKDPVVTLALKQDCQVVLN